MVHTNTNKHKKNKHIDTDTRKERDLKPVSCRQSSSQSLRLGTLQKEINVPTGKQIPLGIPKRGLLLCLPPSPHLPPTYKDNIVRQ